MGWAAPGESRETPEHPQADVKAAPRREAGARGLGGGAFEAELRPPRRARASPWSRGRAASACRWRNGRDRSNFIYFLHDRKIDAFPYYRVSLSLPPRSGRPRQGGREGAGAGAGHGRPSAARACGRGARRGMGAARPRPAPSRRGARLSLPPALRREAARAQTPPPKTGLTVQQEHHKAEARSASPGLGGPRQRGGARGGGGGCEPRLPPPACPSPPLSSPPRCRIRPVRGLLQPFRR